LVLGACLVLGICILEFIRSFTISNVSSPQIPTCHIQLAIGGPTIRKPKTDDTKPKVRGKKAIIVGVIVIAIIILLANVLYLFVLPRVNLEIITVYNEGVGGGGTGGMININTKLKNIGTVKIDDLTITVTVFNSTDHQMDKLVSPDNQISPSNDREIKINFIGNHYETYYIEVELSFYSNQKNYDDDYSYKTYEDSMNIKFEDEIFEWGF
jgi:flagellar basal body-associated protein FliL